VVLLLLSEKRRNGYHSAKVDDSGDGLRLLQEHLGHVSFNTTARYRKVAGEELKGWYDRLWQEEGKTNGA